jgi:hypothetical protein
MFRECRVGKRSFRFFFFGTSSRGDGTSCFRNDAVEDDDDDEDDDAVVNDDDDDDDVSVVVELVVVVVASVVVVRNVACEENGRDNHSLT